MAKKGDIIEGIVERNDFPNIGVLTAEDKSILVKSVIEGQKVRVQIQKTRKNKAEARLLEILSPSPLETNDHVCPHFGKCGGCLYGNIPYEEEIRIKADQVKRLLAPVIGDEVYDACYKGIEPSPVSEGYRNKMEFSFGDEYKGGPLCLGMHKKGASYDIVTVDGCQIADEDFSIILSATLDFFKEKGISYFHRKTHEGLLRHLVIRKGIFTDSILVDLVTASGMRLRMLREWKNMLLNLPIGHKISGILHTVNDRISDVVEDQGTESLYGREGFKESLLGLDFAISPFSFFQTNSKGAEVLYSEVKNLVKDKGSVYDLYCGTGTIGLVAAKDAKEVSGVEIVPEAIDMANLNAMLNEIDNVKFICGDVEKVLDTIETLPDTIILDPPREGLRPKALTKVLSYGVSDIIYISCKPTSLARDLPLFMEAGMKPKYIKLVDMFPRTGNVETICHLSR